MTSEATSPESAPAAIVEKGKSPSIVWIVPIVAALIGGWLWFDTVANRGPAITISFATGDGLEAGKTKLKYKSMDVGVVDSITFTADMTNVVAHATMEKSAENLLTDGAQFWVVRPRLGATGISGLDTLIAGPYISVSKGTGAPAEAFVGLEEIPPNPEDRPGTRITLVAESLGSISSGAPVYYHGIPVGEIQGHKLTEDMQSVEITAFVWEPQDQLLNSTSRFWNVSGIDVEMGADGMNISVESLEALLAGGVEFESSRDADGTKIANDQRFKLYGDQREMRSDVVHQVSVTYITYFEGNARGLDVGAPLTFMGIKVGEVSKVNLQFDDTVEQIRVMVTLVIEPENIGGVEGARSDERARAALDQMIDKGLRAQLQTGSLITGELLVELDFHPDEPAKLFGHDSHPEIPSIPSALEGLTEKVDRVLAKLESLPLESLLANADGLVQDIQSLVSDVDKQVAPVSDSLQRTLGNADATLESARQAMDAVNLALAPDSAIRYDLSTALEELAAAMRSVRILAGYLERHPDALLFGKSSSGGRK